MRRVPMKANNQVELRRMNNDLDVTDSSVQRFRLPTILYMIPFSLMLQAAAQNGCCCYRAINCGTCNLALTFLVYDCS